MLKIQFKDGRTDPIELIAPGKTLGKGDANDIVIDEAGVNGFHADLKVDGDQVTITDINTESGTLVNGEKISHPIPLRAGDTITIAGVEMEVVEEDISGGGKTLVLSGTALLQLGTDSWSLVADSGPEKGQVIPIVDRVEIGRALECDISILEPALSRKHAELELVGDDLILKDLGSVNGTWVNGEKIDEVKLKDGDRMQFDKISFIVSAPS
jgi:pSer/pThr/pTyr-binding forkhead associated (FHA) protein